MKTETITVRPRNGLCAEAFWRIRHWCQKEGFSFSDIINSVLPALSYYLHNHCTIDKARNMATVDLNIGPVEILHVINGRLYPLVTEINTDKKVLSLEEIQERVSYWYKQNQQCLSHTDLILLNSKHATEKSKQNRRKSSASAN